jgi:hypothetical protein
MVATVPLVEMQQNSMEINNLGGNAIISAGSLTRSFSHPQLHRIPSHISIEKNPVTVIALRTETILNVQTSVIESSGANAIQSDKNHHIASTVCQISENQNVGARTNQCKKSGRQQTTTTDYNNSKQQQQQQTSTSRDSRQVFDLTNANMCSHTHVSAVNNNDSSQQQQQQQQQKQQKQQQQQQRPQQTITSTNNQQVVDLTNANTRSHARKIASNNDNCRQQQQQQQQQ